jgi:hypothetical protein
MNKWLQISSAIYYSGVGAVLLGTTLRFLYRLIKGHNDDAELLNDLREEHLPYMYSSLSKIAKKLDVDLDEPPTRL